MLRPHMVVLDLALALLTGAGGVAGAWLLRRHSTLSIRNLYPLAALAISLVSLAIALRIWTVVIVLVPLAAPLVAAASAGRRWRLADLGAGEELRNHELSRRWICQTAPERPAGERVYLRGQGELVRERPWLG